MSEILPINQLSYVKVPLRYGKSKSFASNTTQALVVVSFSATISAYVCDCSVRHATNREARMQAVNRYRPQATSILPTPMPLVIAI